MCTVCPYSSKPCTSVTSLITGYKHEIKQNLNCDTENIIYYWRCKKPSCNNYSKCEYIGLTTKSHKVRFGQHLQYIRSSMLNQPAGEHFNKKGHNITHMEGLAIEHVISVDPFVLRAREWRLIQKFDTYRNGLNKQT